MIYSKDHKLDAIIKDKRIVIVGPSSHLVGQKLGKFIDEHDVICRVNDVIPKGREEDYGSRTDIMFHSCSTRYLDNLKKKIEDNKEVSVNIKLVFCTAVKAQHDGGGNVLENFKKVNIHNTPFSWIGNNGYWWAHKTIGCEPNTGQTAILLMLQHNIQSLDILGFSFYAQYKEQGYGACYYDWEEYLPEKKYPATSNPLIGHQQPPQIKFFVDNILKDDRVKIEKYLAEILNIKTRNLVEIND